MNKAKQHIKKYERFYKAFFMALIPLLACIVTCGLQGYSIRDAYIPASSWNDELFYYKQVEGMISHGYPYGYFGFNESHANVLSFAAWSPVLVWPWLIWGKLFGWSLMAPIYCNIVFMMLSVFLFVWIVKPGIRQMVRMAVLFAVFPLFTRYMLSVMPECTCFGMLIVFFGYAYAYMKEEKYRQLIGMFVISSLLTLMRPYMLIFMLLPIFLLVMKKKWIGAGISSCVLISTGLIYILIKKFLAAEYFTALFDTTWISTFLREGLLAGFQFMFSKLHYAGTDFMLKCMQGITDGLATGAFFAGFLLVMLIVGIYGIYQLIKKDYKQGLLYGHLAFCFFAMWMALLLMYKMQEGSKHLLTFIAAGLFAMAMMEVKHNIHVIICSAAFLYLYSNMIINDPDYRICFRSDALVEEMERTEKDFHTALQLNTENVPNFDNDVIWVTYDNDSETDQTVVTSYQILYGIPTGFGISCCYPEYILDNFETLQSKYICVSRGGNIDLLCQTYGLEEITSGLNAVCYRLR